MHGGGAGDGGAWRRVLGRLLSRPVMLAAVGAGFIGTVVVGAKNFGPIVIALILFSPVAATLITLLAMSMMSAKEWLGREATIIKGAMLRRLRCPSCTYDITGVEPGGDGCTVCPECSAAWRMSAMKYDPAERVVVLMPMARPPADDPTEMPGTSLRAGVGTGAGAGAGEDQRIH